VRFGKGRIKPPSRAKIVQRPGDAAEGAESEAAIQPEGGNGGIGGDGAGKKIGGAGGVAFVASDEAEEIQGVGLVRIGLDDLTVERGGGGETAGPMVFEGAVESRWGGFRHRRMEAGERGRGKSGPAFAGFRHRKKAAGRGQIVLSLVRIFRAEAWANEKEPEDV